MVMLETVINMIKKSYPAGSISMYAGSTAPTGYLLCDGSAVSRTTYSALFTAIGTAYGAGDGSTTFNVPNLKGRVPVGYDSSQTEFNALGKTGGAKTHTLTVAQLPSHSHAIKSQSGNYPAADFTDEGFMRSWASNYTLNNTTNIADAGSGQAHNNLQPYIVFNYIIKT